MHNSFDKARMYQEQARRETDPVMKRQAIKRAKQYHNLDLKEEKRKLRAAKPHYALGRVIMIFGGAMLAFFGVVLLAAHIFPDVSFWKVVPATIALVVVVGACALFVLGKLSESSFIDLLKAALQSGHGLIPSIDGPPSKQNKELPEASEDGL
jgi:Flp pilus assembly protein TadB